MNDLATPSCTVRTRGRSPSYGRQADGTDQGQEKSLPLLLTVDEAAALLRTTRAAVYMMVSRGQLPGVTRIGRRVLVGSRDLLDWLAQKRVPSPKE